MNEADRLKKLKKLRKQLRGLHEEIAVLANSSRATQANVRQAVDICEKEIYYYENLTIDTEGEQYILESTSGLRRELTIVENTVDPFNGKISAESDIGGKLIKLAIGDKIKLGKEDYILKSKGRIKL
jgi:hypothetical protein